MQSYLLKNYHTGFEQGQARIGIEVARKWIWPYAYDLDDLLKASAQPDFDPESHFYCFMGDEMVGYMFSRLQSSEEEGYLYANLEFPRMVAEHEQAAEMLLEWAIEKLREKGVSRAVGRVTTMCPGDIRLAEKVGFAIRDWGYKVYYAYQMAWGSIDLPVDRVEEIDPMVDLAECATLASIWYKRPVEWCLDLLHGWYNYGILAHLGVREEEKIVAACLTAPNVLRPSTAANYYIYTPDEIKLKALLKSAVNICIEQGVDNLIADLINDHRKFEHVYEELGFKRVAEWARCEKILI